MSGVHCQKFPDCMALGFGNAIPTCGQFDCPGKFRSRLNALVAVTIGIECRTEAMLAPTNGHDGSKRPAGSNADEWHLFLSEHLDKATFSSGLTFMAVQIAEAIDAAAKTPEVARLRAALVEIEGVGWKAP